MRGLPLIIILLLPAMIALGHDAYLFHQNHMPPGGQVSFDLLMKEFKFSALGFIWTTYDVESYKLTVSSLAEEDWAIIDYLLTFKAFFVGLGFAAFFITIFGIMALFGKGPLSSGTSRTVYSSEKNALKSRDKTEKFKYKRK